MSDLLKGMLVGKALGELAKNDRFVYDPVPDLEKSLEGWKAANHAAVGVIHNVRAKLNAKTDTEEALFRQLAEANVKVALADPEVFDKVASENYKKLYFDEDVIAKTYDKKDLWKDLWTGKIVLPKSKEKYIQDLIESGEPIDWRR